MLAPEPSDDGAPAVLDSKKDWRRIIARRAAKEVKDGWYLNLGVGLTTLLPEYLPPGVNVWLESENGILGMGPYPTRDQVGSYLLPRWMPNSPCLG